MHRLKKINNVRVGAVRLDKSVQLKPKCHKLFDLCYCNVFICAKKKSGKTCLIAKILKESAGKNTKLVFIVPTLHKDETYSKIVKSFRKKGNPIQTFTSLMDGKDSVIDQVLQDEDEESESESSESESEVETQNSIDFGDAELLEKASRKPRKPKYLTPKIIFIVDDCGSQLRHKSVGQLMKKHRHYQSMCIFSSQWTNDLDPQSQKQLDYWLGFKGHSQKKMIDTHSNLDLSTSFEDFYDMYNMATEKKYNFFYVDSNKDKFRRNFCEEFI